MSTLSPSFGAELLTLYLSKCRYFICEYWAKLTESPASLGCRVAALVSSRDQPLTALLEHSSRWCRSHRV